MNKNSILKKGQIIDHKYTINFFIKKGDYAETYRIQNDKKQIKLLKLFDYKKLHHSQFTENDEVLEIEILKNINHPNILKYYDSGDIVVENQKYAYLVLDFISGETLSERLKRESFSTYEAKEITLGILNGLNYLHNKQILHNEISMQNIMLDLSGSIPIPKIIDFGYSRYIHQPISDFVKEGINPFYMASEAFNKVFSIQSDLFSVGALYYHLLEELPPYFTHNKISEEKILDERKKKLNFSNETDEQTKLIISKALSNNPENRFQSCKDFIKALNGEMIISSLPEKDEKINIPKKQVKIGKGFSSIAGMQELKDTLKLDVIDALNDKERYKEYGLSIPNGILLYGPPGCGKTFFAEKFAEEIGFNFYQIKPSDIQSKWVNASQENIKKLFDEARENAPSIIFIDELDALVPNRENDGVNHMNTSAVNEFLAQMNNCGADNIFIIGATNRPTSIDPAIMRSGRLDKHIYISPPDFDARKSMFEIYLKNRPIDIGLDYEKLAQLTDNFVSSDIKFLCDEASRKALKEKSRITMQILEETITNSTPSVSSEEIQKYSLQNTKLKNKETPEDRPRIGFK
ncbi:AAA family ATPase [Bergeyella zoohelcum]|uniref:AAA family ATPase n=1 Tax=Bergeyella zoohelcum TaxID=1015 RepID=UPI002A9090CC|nr:AAA family ATPase [Bergeyella zoohelcum]MDY6026463.1 AAA family ATPase [Bergeyella zoohelcum]